ncbi:hypothetical protein GCM10010156_48690 [Planobispora rosea]|uniref:Uncharacterized protein n=2 Tax=Planobispora rosea TaxID=35762 RepID=A0A8J3S5A0_PLARO|nr:hypothetical protein GCM10010156_48690 [Planobispora rosea]GIH86380.1 hypothetical protein Pro02_47880 [Planobispora rosea]
MTAACTLACTLIMLVVRESLAQRPQPPTRASVHSAATYVVTEDAPSEDPVLFASPPPLPSPPPSVLPPPVSPAVPPLSAAPPRRPRAPTTDTPAPRPTAAHPTPKTILDGNPAPPRGQRPTRPADPPSPDPRSTILPTAAPRSVLSSVPSADPPPAAQLNVAASRLTLNPARPATLTLTATGGELRWQTATDAAPHLRLSPPSGTLQPGQQTSITVQHDGPAPPRTTGSCVPRRLGTLTLTWSAAASSTGSGSARVELSLNPCDL